MSAHHTLAAQIVLIFGCLALKTWGCPNKDRANEILEAEGYIDIKLGGGHGWACGRDLSATGFRALALTGQRVHGAVCCGIVMKACTVRIGRVDVGPRYPTAVAQ